MAALLVGLALSLLGVTFGIAAWKRRRGVGFGTSRLRKEEFPDGGYGQALASALLLAAGGTVLLLHYVLEWF